MKKTILFLSLALFMVLVQLPVYADSADAARRKNRTPSTAPVTSVDTTPTTSSSVLFSEYFTRPDGLLADNYGNNDPQGKWDVTSQSLYVKSNQGYTDSPIFRAVTNKSDFTNFTLNAEMKKTTLGINAWDGANLFFRYKDYDNLYVAGLRNDNQLQLKKKVAGVYYTLAMVPVNSTELNRYYKLKVVANGSNIQVFVDGVKKVDINDPSFTSGKVGMRTDNIQAYFDNFEVHSL